ncbi:CRISPR-associated protein Csx19 [Anaerovibrio slackiae]|uniref:type III-D CRISPR-associated protein Csx19 n=1 Tax=Anaerovibrio slackiae TaxID=2652309 RepID=UPI0038672F40
MSAANIVKYPYKAVSCLTSRKRAVAGSWQELLALLAEALPEGGLVTAWLPQQVLWGRYDGKGFTFAKASSLTENVLEMRVFSKEAEVYARNRGDNTYLVRICHDYPAGAAAAGAEGMETEYVDSLSRLWGENAGVADGYAVLQDKDRKIRLEIPVDANHCKYGLVTRNYIGYTENNQAGYVDSRYVAIENGEVE